MELPPRARRIPAHRQVYDAPYGTTSACAENTKKWVIRACAKRNYLRVRGEYGYHIGTYPTYPELPPRARRIQRKYLNWPVASGTTSACAENTFSIWATGMTWWNYLRVRGEYIEFLHVNAESAELPPRARRILITMHVDGFRVGTTSACAENTIWAFACNIVGRNYLRVRGEYTHRDHRCSQDRELPPRARRIHTGANNTSAEYRTTSACAENTPKVFVHQNSTFLELPPRARRIPNI